MLSIKTAYNYNARTDEDFGFQSRVYNLAAATLLQEVDAPVLAAFKKGLDAFDDALKQSIKNSHTEDVEAADNKVDFLYTGFTMYIRSLTYHPSEQTSTGAKMVEAILDKYGTITKLAYDQEYGALHNSMQELTAVAAETQTLLAMPAWLEAITLAEAQFQTLRSMQTSERGLYQVGLLKEARAAADEAYKKFVNSINAFAVAFGEENYAAFIREVNVMVDNLNANIKARSTRAKNQEEEEESV